jgi:hypothetical protein
MNTPTMKNPAIERKIEPNLELKLFFSYPETRKTMLLTLKNLESPLAVSSPQEDVIVKI